MRALLSEEQKSEILRQCAARAVVNGRTGRREIKGIPAKLIETVSDRDVPVRFAVVRRVGGVYMWNGDRRVSESGVVKPEHSRQKIKGVLSDSGDVVVEVPSGPYAFAEADDGKEPDGSVPVCRGYIPAGTPFVETKLGVHREFCAKKIVADLKSLEGAEPNG